MDTPTSAAPDEKAPSLDLVLAKEKSKLSGQLEIGADRIQLFRRPLDLKFDRRTPGVSFRTPKNARIPDVRGRQRATPNRQRFGRN